MTSIDLDRLVQLGTDLTLGDEERFAASEQELRIIHATDPFGFTDAIAKVIAMDRRAGNSLGHLLTDIQHKTPV